MGWCSGTEIFDDVLDEILDSGLSVDTQSRIVRLLADALENHDWDCQSGSRHYDHMIVQNVMRDIHPDWFDDEDEDDES